MPLPRRAGRARPSVRSGRHVSVVSELEQFDATPPGPDAGPAAIVGRSPWRLAWERLRHDRVAVTCASVIVLIVLFGILAPLVAHLVGHSPNAQDLTNGLTPQGLPKGPTSTDLVGT